MVNGRINLKSLNIDELAGVVNLYPWFAAARKELCLRIARLGGKGWGEREYAGNALYLGDRRFIYDIMRSGKSVDYSDKDLDALLKAYTAGEEVKTVEEPEVQKRKVRTVGGDFFSQDEYDSVRKEDDGIFSSFAAKAREDSGKDKSKDALVMEFCTETLAQIYVEQGYYEQAKYIYSKLILRYPEKSAYFATLIDKLGQLTDN